MDYKKAGVDIEAITDIHIMKMNAVLLNESCAAIGITVSGQTPEVLRALGAAKEKGASTILFTSRSSSDYDAFCDEVLLLQSWFILKTAAQSLRSSRFSL